MYLNTAEEVSLFPSGGSSEEPLKPYCTRSGSEGVSNYVEWHSLKYWTFVTM